MRTVNKLIMALAGLLLIVAAGLKFYEMIDTCVPHWKENPTGLWESYEFFLLQIPLEFALGVWMLSGLFRKASWIAGTLAFLGFIGVTLTKWLTGAESCGCFGQIHVDPKITLFAMDIPFFLLLAIFRPKGTKLLPPPWPNLAYLLIVFVPTIALMVTAPPAMVTLQQECLKPADDQPDPTASLKLQLFKLKQDLTKKQQEIDKLKAQLKEAKSPTIQNVQFVNSLADPNKPDWMVLPTNIEHDTLEIYINRHHMLSINFDDPNRVMLSMIDPEQQTMKLTDDGHIELCWIEKEQPQPAEIDTPPAQTSDANDQPPAVNQWDWLQYIVEEDVRQQLTQGLVVVMMHRFDCPACEEMAPRYSEYYKEMTEQGEDAFKIAFLAIPPYGETNTIPPDTTCINGKLTDERKWGLMSPYVVALIDGQLIKTWEPGTAPEPENILNELDEAFAQ